MSKVGTNKGYRSWKYYPYGNSGAQLEFEQGIHGPYKFEHKIACDLVLTKQNSQLRVVSRIT